MNECLYWTAREKRTRHMLAWSRSITWWAPRSIEWWWTFTCWHVCISSFFFFLIVLVLISHDCSCDCLAEDIDHVMWGHKWGIFKFYINRSFAQNWDGGLVKSYDNEYTWNSVNIFLFFVYFELLGFQEVVGPSLCKELSRLMHPDWRWITCSANYGKPSKDMGVLLRVP